MVKQSLRFVCLFVFLLIANNSVKAQTNPAVNDSNAAALAASAQFTAELKAMGLLSQNPGFSELMKAPPAPGMFKKAFIAFVPEGLLRMKTIVSEHKVDDDDTTNVYPLKTLVLPGTGDNYYEYVTDGMLVFDADFRATIASGLKDDEAVKRVAQWKYMLQKSFPEDAALMKDKTDASGNQFITITHAKALVNNVGRTGYTTLPGWTLTLQNVKDKAGRYLCLVLVP